MDSKTASLDFAIIGHQDSWQNITLFINGIRNVEYEKLSTDKIKDIFGFIPPRAIFNIRVRSNTGDEIKGVYIETFIDPDQLEVGHLRKNIAKVSKAINVAEKLGAKIVTLGGFTSIVLEGNIGAYVNHTLKLTTGNTLTTAYIVKGIEKAIQEKDLKLNGCKILIIGATGDIGLACTHYLKDKAKQLLLCARNKKRLKQLSIELDDQGFNSIFDTSLNNLIPKADIIISVASSKNIQIAECKPNSIICDAGYPKNLEEKIEKRINVNLFHGGMGAIGGGYDFNPDYKPYFYNYPSPNIAHGCVLEAVVLAFERKYENYSFGKGNIKQDKIEEIYNLSLKHGIELAPFYNTQGLLKK